MVQKTNKAAKKTGVSHGPWNWKDWTNLSPSESPLAYDPWLPEGKKFQLLLKKEMQCLVQCLWQMDYRKRWWPLMLSQWHLGTVWIEEWTSDDYMCIRGQRFICSCGGSKYSWMQPREWIKREQGHHRYLETWGDLIRALLRWKVLKFH